MTLPIPFRRVLVVVNPIAGRGRARRRAEELRRALEAEGVVVELFHTGGRGDASRRLERLERELELVVAVGGDGTVGEVLAGLPEERPLAVLPMGTANVLGLDLGLPRSVRGLVETIRTGRSIAIDIADAGGRPCFLVTGIGVDGWIVRRVAEQRRGPIRKWHYLRTSLSTLWRYRPPRLSVEVDGERLAGSFGWVLVSNMIGYGGFMHLCAGRRLDDGLFEVFLFPEATRLALLRYALRGIARSLPGGGCRMLQARHVRVESEQPVPYEVDGDPGGETPVEVRVTGTQHRLLVPRAPGTEP